MTKVEEIWRSCETCADCHHDSALYEGRCATCLGKERDAAYAVLEKLVYHYQEAEEIIQDCVALLAKRKA